MGDTSDRVLVKAWNRSIGREQNVQVSYNMIKTIEADHARIHDGVAFHVSHISSLASGGVHFMLIVPNSSGMHLRQQHIVVTGAPITATLYESSSYSNVGSVQQVNNMNRQSANVSSSSIYSAPTIVVTGTAIEHTLIPVTAKDSGGTGEGPAQEWILDGTGPYVLGVKNDAGAAITVGMKLFWYEPGLLL